MEFPTIMPIGAELEPTTRLIRRSFDEADCLPPLVLDLSEVEALTGGGLGELVALHNRLRDLGGRLILCGVRPAAHEALEVTGLTTLIEVRRARRDGTVGP